MSKITIYEVQERMPRMETYVDEHLDSFAQVQ